MKPETKDSDSSLSVEEWLSKVNKLWVNIPDFRIDTDKLKHLAVICDGNRRAAQKRGIDPWTGHRIGVEVIKGIMETGQEWGIKHLTFWTWSTENWKRDDAQVGFVMNLAARYLEDDEAIDTLDYSQMKNNQLVLLKLGGSLITDKNKPFSARREVIIRLGKEIKSAMSRFSGKLIIAHGSGSFGHPVAEKYKVADGIIQKNSIKGIPWVADAAIRINRIVIEDLLKVGLPVVSFAPASLMTADDKQPANSFLEPISRSLKWGLIPVLYGDIIFDRKRGWCIFSSEKILGILAKAFLKSFTELKVFYCGDTDGVYDEKDKTVDVISPKSFIKLQKKIKGSTAADVTGGMLHKVQEAVSLVSDFGIEALIFSGKVKGQLKRALKGERVSRSTKIVFDDN